MAFLDNSGDILLDAVLTDTGRKRMAEGTFRITKFALADDEIDYSLYNLNDSRGSAYFDLDILGTPVLEAFTDNAAGLKSKLLSITRTDLEYLPVMKLFDGDNESSKINDTLNSFIVPVNSDTLDSITLENKSAVGTLVNNNRRIAIDQGIDNTARPFTDAGLEASLKETQFIIELDNRLGLVRRHSTPTTTMNPAYIDDDDIASYIVTNDDSVAVISNTSGLNIAGDNAAYPSYTSVRGEFGSRLQFSINATQTLQSNDFLFERIGGTMDANELGSYTSQELLYIDANIRVIGITTGYRLDIPVRFIKIAGTTGTL